MGKRAVTGRTSGLVAVFVGLALCLPGEASADIYQYVDADGVVHFTTTKGTPQAKLYLKSEGKTITGARPGVTPSPPQDRDPARFTRFDEHIRQAATFYQIPEQLVRAVIK